uniref:Rootletin-like coiled-coil domain-containing protein n=1 Tax=Podarcis muralis TaxID=64176 RepID=A0A670IIX1_PODMU
MEEDQAASSMKTQTVHLLPEEQLVALHHQMVENQASYQHRLQNSQEAQHRQAVLVQKLQAKVLQYRNWCKELETRLEANRGSHPHQWDRKEDRSLEKALIQLEEEQQRCENLAGVNNLLREHLDKANEVNGALREDVSKLIADWTRARDELEHKESEWHKEREFFESYMRTEHDRLFGIWRQVVTLHRYFVEMKTATDRDLSELKAEQARLSGCILVSCLHLSSGTQLLDTNSFEKLTLRGQAQQQQLHIMPKKLDMEKEIYQQAQAIVSLHVKGELAKEDLHNRVIELTALLEQSQKQNEEKEMSMKTLRDTVEILVCYCCEGLQFSSDSIV